MKKILFALLFAFIGNIAAAQQSAKISKFEGSDIRGLIANGAFDVRISQGEQTGVTIEIREDQASKLVVDMTEEGYIRLSFGSDVGQFFKGKNRPFVNLVVSELRYLSLSGNISTIGKGKYSSGEISQIMVGAGCSLDFINISTEKLSLDVTGGAKVDELTVDADEARIDLSNASKASIKGKVGLCDIRTGGTSSLDILMLEVPQIKAVITGMSLVKANISGEANVTRSGTASFRYMGEGKLIGEGKRL